MGKRPENGPPIWSIGFAAALMISVPAILYLIAPVGPIREGDTIFSGGARKVPLAYPLLFETAKFDGTCLLDPHDPLMVTQLPSDRKDGLIRAKVQGKTALEWPFCPPQSEVLLAQHQIVQKEDTLLDTISGLLQWREW
ncbi:hypothetical protein [Petrachloros mirabilis]